MLFDNIIFGPIQSRRLGLSLGINLINPSAKHCNFDCIYCECGWNADNPNGYLNDMDSVLSRLEDVLIKMQEEGKLPDTITFAGNGEPTMHPKFEQIIDATMVLRNRYAPMAKISVLSNATQIDKPQIYRALCKVDNNILKFDSAIFSTYRLINKPNNPRSIIKQIELLQSFEGNCTIQTMFLKGEYEGKRFDNTTPEEISALIDALKTINPKQVMIYSLDRATPADRLVKITSEELNRIAAKLEESGLEVSVA